MTMRNVTIDNNLVTDVAKDYEEMSGILSTYADHTVIAHNEVSNLAYDGIDVGWGWGANDAGGSPDYQNRGLYAYQPVYTTPTTLRNTQVTDNLVHGVKKVFHDGGSLYNLSANPGAVFSGNYIYDTQHTVGLYLDEGSRASPSTTTSSSTHPGLGYGVARRRPAGDRERRPTTRSAHLPGPKPLTRPAPGGISRSFLRP